MAALRQLCIGIYWANQTGKDRMSESTARPRNLRIEALRLVAIAGIAVFHTFQPWFSEATDGSWAAGPPALAALGCVNLLGAYGNNVFFLISGLFLVPRAAAAASAPGYWSSQGRALARRALVIGATVALYGVLALAVSAWVTPLSGVSLSDPGWLLGGLEFIWVYLACMVATPVIGWVWRRVARPRAAVVAILACVFAVNAYIAFVSPGSDVRGLLEWRKLMSALTYLAAFLAGGALGEKNLARPGRALAASCAAALLLEGAAAAAGSTWLLEALSFKSTSLLSFALAAASVALAAQGRPTPGDTPARRAVQLLAPSILGFYVIQSMFYSLWRPVADAACEAGLIACGAAGMLLAGTAASLAVLVVALLIDRAVRVAPLRALRLG